MLDANRRRLLIEALQAPEGFELTGAIACTYSLDLLALASIPLLCLGHESCLLDEEPESGVGQQLAGIECVRRNMKKFTVFCQAGAIHVPAEAKSLFLWLEPSVVEVTPPKDRYRAVFHPKLWILRFKDQTTIRYRAVVLSRNLTFDRSWDVLAALEGDLQNRTNNIRDAVPLAEFVAALGSTVPSTRVMSARNTERVAQFAKELSKVKFACVGEELDWAFWPLGVKKGGFDSSQLFKASASPFKDWSSRVREGKRQLLVVSPFLGANAVKSLTELSQSCPVHLVSEEHALDQFSHCAAPSPSGLGPGRVWAFQGPEPTDSLAGLHAKLWVADDGWNSHMWMGSANATDAAFGRNIEFLLQLTGPRSRFGVQAFLDEGSSSGGERTERPFRGLLVPYKSPSSPGSDSAETQQRQRELDFRLMDLVAKGMVATVSQTAEGFSLAIQLSAACDVDVRPISVEPEQRKVVDPGPGGLAVFDGLAMLQLTEFWVVSISDGDLNARCATRVPTEGMPEFEERGHAVLSRHVGDMNALAQYLGFLMADGDQGLQGSLRSARRGRRSQRSADKAKPLLETLMYALARQPQVLDDMDALLGSLGQRGADWLKEPRFQELWASIRAAKQMLEGNI